MYICMCMYYGYISICTCIHTYARSIFIFFLFSLIPTLPLLRQGAAQAVLGQGTNCSLLRTDHAPQGQVQMSAFGHIKWEAFPSAISWSSWVLAELILVQQEESEGVAGECSLLGKPLWSCEGAAWISWGSRAAGIRSKPVTGGGGRDKITGLRGGSPAAAWSAEWEGRVKAMEPSTSLPRVLPARVGRPAKSAKRSNHVAGHGPEAHIPHAGAGARRTPRSYTLSRIVCPFCLCPWVMGMNVWSCVRWAHLHSQAKGSRSVPATLPVHGPRWRWRPRGSAPWDAVCILNLSFCRSCYLWPFQALG